MDADIYRNIPGMLTQNEADALYQYAQQARLGIVEIGSYLGMSGVALALGTKAGHGAPIWCIDPHEDYEVRYHHGQLIHHYKHSNRRDFMQNVINAGCADTIRLVGLPSLQVARAWDRHIDLLFIDALHDYNNVLADLRAWYPFVANGGRIALHDYDLPDVQQAVAHFLSYQRATIERTHERLIILKVDEVFSQRIPESLCELGY